MADDDPTPILRADALDEEDLEFATGGVIENDPGEHGDSVPAILNQEGTPVAYELPGGGWGIRYE